MNDPAVPAPTQAATLPPNTEGLQEPSGQTSNHETAAAQSLVEPSDKEAAAGSNTSGVDQRNTVCDGCDESITGTPHRCQDCPDFAYCSRCISEASLIHPGHSFKIVKKQKFLEADYQTANQNDATAPDLAPVESDAKEIVTNGQFECRSCEPVTQFLSGLGALMRHKPKQGKGVPPQNISFPWLVRVSRLIEATQRGCAFCTLLLDNFFGPANVTFKPKKQWHSKASKHDKERMLLVKHCMGSLTKLQYGSFGFIIQPLCRRVGSALPDFDALEIRVSDMRGREQNDVGEIFNHLELKADVYAVKGEKDLA